MASDDRTSLPSSEPENPGQKTGQHPEFAKFAVALALFVFLSMIGLILFHWLQSSPPDAFLQVSGDEAQSGASVEVIDNSGGDHSAIPQRLTEGNKYTARFPLPPGDYTIEVTKGAVVHKMNLILREGNGWIYDLTKVPALNNSSTQPAMNGSIEGNIGIR